MTRYLAGSRFRNGLVTVCVTARAPSMVMRAAVPATFAVVFTVCEATVTAAPAMQPARKAVTILSARARKII